MDYNSIAEIASIIAKTEGVEVILPDKNNSISGTPQNLVLDIKKYLKEFNKTSFVSSSVGLNKTIEWIKTLNANGDMQ